MNTSRGDVKLFLLGVGIPTNVATLLEASGETIEDLKRMGSDELSNYGLTEEAISKLKTRKPIPKETLTKLLTDSARTCCVCHGRRSNSIVIHHIIPWGETQDNSENNLVVLCINCHEEAHTNHQTSKNLGVQEIRDHKKHWLEIVRKEAKLRAAGLVKIQNVPFWDYFNYQRIFSLIINAGIDLAPVINFRVGKMLAQKGFINEYGLFNFNNWPSNIESGSHWTAFGDGMYISTYMAEVTKHFLENINLRSINGDINVQESSSKINIGNIIMLQDTFTFKRMNNSNEGKGQIKLGYLRKNGLKIEFQIDLWECITISAKARLSSRAKCTVVGAVTSIIPAKGLLEVKVSALAIGYLSDNVMTL